LVDLKAGLPEAANSRVKSVRAVFAWHQEGDETARNPCAGIKKLKPKRGGGFHAWTVEEVAAYEAVHAIGTQARVAFDLALYTLQGRSDVARFGPEHVTLTDDGPWLVFRRKKSDNPIEIPIIDPLAESIAARPKLDGEAFVLTTEGKPFTANGLGNAFRVWCDEAGLPNCAMHGLRKAQSSKLAELGIGDLGIGAVTGHAPGSRSLSIYTAAARRKLMAKQAMRRLAESLPGSQMSQKAESNVKNWDIQEEKTDAC
jgi:integrase